MNDQDKKILAEFAGKIGNSLASAISQSAKPVQLQHKQPFVETTNGILTIALATASLLGGGMTLLIKSTISPELATLVEQNAGLRRDVDRLLDRGDRATLEQPPTLPASQQAKAIEDAAQRALARKLLVPSPVIENASKPLFVNVTDDKWRAVGPLLNLRSFYNSTLDQASLKIAARITPSEPSTAFPSHGPDEWIEFSKASFQLDGQPGERGLLGDNDGQPMKVISHFIFRDCIVTYSGRPIVLVDVFFVNCTFQIRNNGNGQLMAQAILKASDLTSIAIN